MVTWTKILAAMLFLQAPGKSLYSRVQAEEGAQPSVLAEVNNTTAYVLLDKDDDLPNQCKQKGNVACSKPRLRDVKYNGYNLRTEWQRIETYDEGLHRYALIAKSIETVLEDNEWKFPAGRSWRYLVTIAFHESGFRRDVHSGFGSAALGDCRWRKDKKTGKKRMVKGSCRSHGLFQTLFSKPKRTKHFGFFAKELIGVTPDNTQNAVFVATSHLQRIHRYCTKAGPRPFTACMFATYGGTSAVSHPGIQQRVKTYNKLSHAPTELDEYVVAALGLPEGSSAKSRISKSED